MYINRDLLYSARNIHANGTRNMVGGVGTNGVSQVTY